MRKAGAASRHRRHESAAHDHVADVQRVPPRAGDRTFLLLCVDGSEKSFEPRNTLTTRKKKKRIGARITPRIEVSYSTFAARRASLRVLWERFNPVNSPRESRSSIVAETLAGRSAVRARGRPPMVTRVPLMVAI